MEGEFRMLVFREIDMEHFKPWGGGEEGYREIRNLNLFTEFEQYIEELYPKGIDEGDLNDILWYDRDTFIESQGFIKCEICEDWVHERDVVEDNEYRKVCESCIEDYYIECPDCGDYIQKEDAVEYDDALYCPDCAAERDEQFYTDMFPNGEDEDE
jgi:hypothetical protein